MSLTGTPWCAATPLRPQAAPSPPLERGDHGEEPIAQGGDVALVLRLERGAEQGEELALGGVPLARLPSPDPTRPPGRPLRAILRT